MNVSTLPNAWAAVAWSTSINLPRSGASEAKCAIDSLPPSLPHALVICGGGRGQWSEVVAAIRLRRGRRHESHFRRWIEVVELGRGGGGGEVRGVADGRQGRRDGGVALEKEPTYSSSYL